MHALLDFWPLLVATHMLTTSYYFYAAAAFFFNTGVYSWKKTKKRGEWESTGNLNSSTWESQKQLHLLNNCSLTGAHSHTGTFGARFYKRFLNILIGFFDFVKIFVKFLRVLNFYVHYWDNKKIMLLLGWSVVDWTSCCCCCRCWCCCCKCENAEKEREQILA